ncbi:RecX family transcriptional regulator [Alloiococcus otitis]|nr:RecX family transcriptional regulator [Alloiococcus otitis]
MINDLEYAKSYIRTAAKINRKGPRLIQNELVQKG